jgi:tRNA modification GTPase
MTHSPYDTIAAVSTPPGEGGIGIVRLSGRRSVEILRDIFVPHREGGHVFESSFHMHLGFIRRGDRIIDEVLVSFMKAPGTYTREDVVEINCHGGAVAVNEVLRLVLARGARVAEPGEFTKRAFINGRIDLAQAEAVLDIVQARTARALNHAVDQLQGSLSSRIGELSEELRRTLMHLEAAIDFPEEEDVGSLDYPTLRERLESTHDELASLVESYDTGKILRDGVLTVISGKPNVGKSSLLNAFVKYDRAIVTEIPGTTRDTIEEQLNLSGIPFILVDTAGITQSDDRIEREGIERSKSHIERAQLVLLVLDGSVGLDDRDRDIARRVAGIPHITIINKSDLPGNIDGRSLKDLEGIDDDFIALSARTGSGLKDLEKRMVEKVIGGGTVGENAFMITNARHYAVLQRALQEIEHALKAAGRGQDPELLAYDVKSTMDMLGEITGQVTSKDIINDIFQLFCIGK